MNGTHWTSSPLAAIHLSGARDLTASAHDRLTHAGTALGLVGAGEIAIEGAWEQPTGALDLGAVTFVTEGWGALSFAAALLVIDRELAHEAGERCAADVCCDCDERESFARSARRELYMDGAADYAMDAAKDRRLGVG